MSLALMMHSSIHPSRCPFIPLSLRDYFKLWGYSNEKVPALKEFTSTRMNEPVHDSKPGRDKHSEDKAGREGLPKAGIFKQRSS